MVEVMRWLILLAIMPAYTTSFAQSTSFWMSDQELNVTFAGKSIAGHYADGVTFEETYKTNRRLEYVEGERRETGKWSVVAGTFCTIYDNEAGGGCFRVHRSSSNCYEFYFLARDEQTAQTLERQGRSSWTARAWRRDAASTCEEQASV